MTIAVMLLIVGVIVAMMIECLRTTPKKPSQQEDDANVKPHIWPVGIGYWMCKRLRPWRPHQPYEYHGLGDSPAEAYAEWKFRTFPPPRFDPFAPSTKLYGRHSDAADQDAAEAR